MSSSDAPRTVTPTGQAPRLLDQVRSLAVAHYGRSEPGERFAGWVLRYVVFHGKRHPHDLGLAEIDQFLEQLAQRENDPLKAIEQAREALTFLYDEVLHVAMAPLPFPTPPKLLDRLRRAIRLRH